LVKVIF